MTSGRRSSSVAGTPTGIVGGVCCSTSVRPRVDRAWRTARQHADRVLEERDLPFDFGNRRRRERAVRLGLVRVRAGSTRRPPSRCV